MMITRHVHARLSPRERVRTPLRSRAREKLESHALRARLSRASDDSDASLARRPSSRVARARDARAKIHATAMRDVRRPCDSCAMTRGRRSCSDAVARSRGRVGRRCGRSIDRSNLARSISRSMDFRVQSILRIDRMARASIEVVTTPHFATTMKDEASASAGAYAHVVRGKLSSRRRRRLRRRRRRRG